MLKNISLRYLFLINALFVFGGSLLGPLYALYVQHISSDVLAISVSWSIFLFSSTFFGFIISRFGDRVKRTEDLLIAGYIVRAIVWFLYIFVGNIYHLFILQLILGIGEALGSPAFNAIFAEHLDKNEHIREYSNWSIIGNVTTAFATIAGGIIVEQLGFHPLFYIMGILAMISAFIASKKLV